MEKKFNYEKLELGKVLKKEYKFYMDAICIYINGIDILEELTDKDVIDEYLEYLSGEDGLFGHYSTDGFSVEGTYYDVIKQLDDLGYTIKKYTPKIEDEVLYLHLEEGEFATDPDYEDISVYITSKTYYDHGEYLPDFQCPIIKQLIVDEFTVAGEKLIYEAQDSIYELEKKDIPLFKEIVKKSKKLEYNKGFSDFIKETSSIF